MGNRLREEVQDPLGQLTQVRQRMIDALNRVMQEIGAGNQITEFGYDAKGNPTSRTDPLGHAELRSYDALDRLIRIVDPAAGQTRYAWNGQDRLTRVTDPRKLVTTYTLDGLGSRSALASPDTGTTLDTHDPAGNVLTRSDARGQVTTTQYDALDRPVLVTHHDGSAVRTTWDSAANGIGRPALIEELSPPPATVVASIAYTYDAQGRVASETRSLGGTTTTTAWQYAAGRLVAMTTPSGKRLDYSHDAMGRIAGIRLTDANTTSVIVSDVSYRPFGGVAGWTDGAGQRHRRSFDQDGRISGYNLGSQNWLLLYDDASRLAYQTDTANAANTGSYGYDALDRLTDMNLGATRFGYAWDATGNRSSHRVGATTRNTQTDPASNRLLAIDTVPARSYTYDASGNVTADGTSTFAYDARGRLARASNAGGTTDYRVDALGQRVRKTGPGGSTVYHYDRDGHLIGESDPGGRFRREYLYLGDIPVAVLQ